MSLTIEPYAPDRIPAVRALNQRLEAGGCPFRFPERSESSWLPKVDGHQLYEEFFLATEGDDVRGGYILKHQPFWLNGKVESIGSLYLPLSEGAVNPRYSKVGVHLFLNATQRQPLLYSLGLGGQGLYPQMLKAAGWRMCTVPFRFLVVHAAIFCRNIAFLRRHPLASIGLDVLAVSGLGHVSFRASRAWRRRRPGAAQSTRAEEVHEFSTWADTVWEKGRSAYTLAGVRDLAALQRLYPATKERFIKLRIIDDGGDVGWAVGLDTTMRNHKYFGDMRVGSIIDCFAHPGREQDVIYAATGSLTRRGVDLIVSNQSHKHWASACDLAGYLTGPSNFFFAASPKLAARVAPWERNYPIIHMTRADGEGPAAL